MSRGVHIFYKLIEEKEGYLRYAYLGGDFSDDKSLVFAYDGIVAIKMDSVGKDIGDREYGIDCYQEKGCVAKENSHNNQIKDDDGTTVDLFALKVIPKIFRRYKETSEFEERGSIVY